MMVLGLSIAVVELRDFYNLRIPMVSCLTRNYPQTNPNHWAWTLMNFGRTSKLLTFHSFSQQSHRTCSTLWEDRWRETLESLSSLLAQKVCWDTTSVSLHLNKWVRVLNFSEFGNIEISIVFLNVKLFSYAVVNLCMTLMKSSRRKRRTRQLFWQLRNCSHSQSLNWRKFFQNVHW